MSVGFAAAAVAGGSDGAVALQSQQQQPHHQQQTSSGGGGSRPLRYRVRQLWNGRNSNHHRGTAAATGASASPLYSRVFLILGVLDGRELNAALALSGVSSAPVGSVFLRVLDCSSAAALAESPLPSDVSVKVLSVKALVPKGARGFQGAAGAAEATQLGGRVREYLRAQLAANPLARHLIVVFKEEGLRLLRRRGSAFPRRYKGSLLGTGQYLALSNCSSQINGLTPLEVRDVGPLQRTPASAPAGQGALSENNPERKPSAGGRSTGAVSSHQNSSNSALRSLAKKACWSHGAAEQQQQQQEQQQPSSSPHFQEAPPFAP